MVTEGVGLTEEETAALGGLLLGFGAAILVAMLVWYIISVIAMWRLFKKAGEPGWKSLVPVYNSYILFDKAWEPLWFWVNLGLTLAAAVGNSLSSQGVASSVMSAVTTIAFVASAVLAIVFSQKLAAAFGKGKGFGVGLWLLNPIFMLILAFGSSVYVGNGRTDD